MGHSAGRLGQPFGGEHLWVCKCAPVGLCGPSVFADQKPSLGLCPDLTQLDFIMSALLLSFREFLVSFLEFFEVLVQLLAHESVLISHISDLLHESAEDVSETCTDLV